MNKTFKNLILMPFNILYRINPELEQRIIYKLKMGSSINLKNPQTYNEKLNWLKLYYRNELLPKCADKYMVREYIKECGYASYLPELYWCGNDVESIPFDILPNSFIIKSTSGSGNNIIVRNKEKIDKENIKKILKKWLKEKYLLAYGEWHYQNIKPSIIIEEFLSDGEHLVPLDYKLFYFNALNSDETGGVGCIAIDSGRFVDHRRNIYDAKWKYMPEVSFGFKHDDMIIEKPELFEKMCEITNKLASPFPHCRVDFYVVGKQLYIGEITFFNGAGYDMITPIEYNLEMGRWIDISTLR